MKVTTTNIAFLALAVLTSAVPVDPTTEQQSGEAVPLKPLAPSSLDAPRDFGITESAGDLSSIPSRKYFETRPRLGSLLGKRLGSPESMKEAAGDLGHPSDFKSLRGSGSDRSDALDGAPGADKAAIKPAAALPVVGKSPHVARAFGWPPSGGAGTGTGTGTSGYGWPPSGGTGTGTGTGGYPAWPPSTNPSPGSGGSGSNSGGSSGSNAGCKAVTLIFARGTTELGTLGTVVGPGLAQALEKDLGEDKVDIEGLQYPADWAGNFNLGATGGVAMAALAKQKLRDCPDTKLILSGYSQGGLVCHNALSAQGLDGSKVAAVVCFGDPFNGQPFQGVDPSRVKEFCDTADTVCPGGQKSGPGWHLSYGSDVQAAAAFIKQAVGL
ncbi:hypothetical protein TI39_contig307g00020 [Zymoseptoria brevis]|uniref:Cutinase n=1 Tax=Zymoseptoria brevis TaxID=1047168 RepID=A0A0F4GU40_9PEZI|nr:hypothetical protein TI39_contig307g00020 [Zymoseptoria brevis]